MCGTDAGSPAQSVDPGSRNVAKKNGVQKAHEIAADAISATGGSCDLRHKSHKHVPEAPARRNKRSAPWKRACGCQAGLSRWFGLQSRKKPRIAWVIRMNVIRSLPDCLIVSPLVSVYSLME